MLLCLDTVGSVRLDFYFAQIYSENETYLVPHCYDPHSPVTDNVNILSEVEIWVVQ